MASLEPPQGPGVMPSAFAAMSAAAPSEMEQAIHIGGIADRSSSSASGVSIHPNVFVRGLPLAWSEAEITAVFQQYGQLSSLRLVRHSVTKQSLGYGFVRFQDPGEAQAAINALDGTSVLGHTLQVKFADADAGPPSSGAASGLTPSDSCYVKHLPATCGGAEVHQLFEPHGEVLDVKLFPCLDQFRGASALVRMATVDSAERAITALNNSTPPGALQSLIVRFAESSAEKAARLTRRERQQSLQRTSLPAALSGGLGALDPAQLQQALATLNINGLGMASATQLNGLSSTGRAASMPLGSAPQYQQAASSSICIKGMPSNADRLWIYENFARFGAVLGMRILIDEHSGLCNGTAFINYADPSAAERARQAMNGVRTADKILHIMVQQSQRYGTAASREASLTNALPVTMQQQQQQQLPAPGEWQHLLQSGALPW